MSARVEAHSSSISTVAHADDGLEDLPPAPGVLTGATVAILWADPRTGHTQRRVQSKPGKGAVTLGRDGAGELAIIVQYNDDEQVFTCKGNACPQCSIISLFPPAAY